MFDVEEKRQRKNFAIHKVDHTAAMSHFVISLLEKYNGSFIESRQPRYSSNTAIGNSMILCRYS